jgi:hypothetical protein
MLSVALLGQCAHQHADYFPLKERSRRVMRVYQRVVVGRDTTETTSVGLVEAVRGQDDIPGIGRAWVVETPYDSARMTKYFYVVKGDSIFQVVPGRGGAPERVLYLLMPLKVGAKWSDSKDQREQSEVVTRDSVAVPAGTFRDCFKVVTTGVHVDLVTEKWLAPGVGVVKRLKQQTWSRDTLTYSLLREEELVEYSESGPPGR